MCNDPIFFIYFCVYTSMHIHTKTISYKPSSSYLHPSSSLYKMTQGERKRGGVKGVIKSTAFLWKLFRITPEGDTIILLVSETYDLPENLSFCPLAFLNNEKENSDRPNKVACTSRIWPNKNMQTSPEQVALWKVTGLSNLARMPSKRAPCQLRELWQQVDVENRTDK